MNLHHPFIRTLGMLLLSIGITACASSSYQAFDNSKLKKLAHIHYQLGIDAIGRQGMLPKAFDELMKSDAILPNQPDVLDALAYAWLLRGDLKKAEAHYLKALKYSNSAKIHNNYANLLNQLKQYTKAEKFARTALDDPRYPNQDLAFINLGNALLGQKKFPESILAFQQAKLFNPNNTLADMRLANTYYQQNRLLEALILYQTILRQQQDNRGAVEGLLTILDKQHDDTKKKTALQQFLQQTSSPTDKAWALKQLGKTDRP